MAMEIDSFNLIGDSPNEVIRCRHVNQKLIYTNVKGDGEVVHMISDEVLHNIFTAKCHSYRTCINKRL